MNDWWISFDIESRRKVIQSYDYCYDSMQLHCCPLQGCRSKQVCNNFNKQGQKVNQLKKDLPWWDDFCIGFDNHATQAIFEAWSSLLVQNMNSCGCSSVHNTGVKLFCADTWNQPPKVFSEKVVEDLETFKLGSAENVSVFCKLLRLVCEAFVLWLEACQRPASWFLPEGLQPDSQIQYCYTMLRIVAIFSLESWLRSCCEGSRQWWWLSPSFQDSGSSNSQQQQQPPPLSNKSAADLQVQVPLSSRQPDQHASPSRAVLLTSPLPQQQVGQAGPVWAVGLVVHWALLLHSGGFSAQVKTWRQGWPL